MITLQSIREALQAQDPYSRMDELVRLELQAGRRVKEIFDTVNPLVDLVLESPGLSSDGEEAFLGTLDALTGNCRDEKCYKDKPSMLIDTSSEMLPVTRAS